jgi:pimeloyl-ACP methyl ester carboxylesterase
MNTTDPARRHCARRVARGGRLLVALLALTALFAPSASARSSDAPSGATAKPTIVLVHGAWADSGSWNGVVRHLQRDGYTVDVPPNPLRGLTVDVATIADFLHTLHGPVVIVGHSYGGAVITNAAVGQPQVKALVYVDAYIPDRGQTLTSLTTAGSCFAVSDITTVLDFAPFPGAPAGVFDSYVKRSVFPECLANGLPAPRAAVLAATQRPLATNAFTDESGTPAWKSIPSWAVVGTADHAIPPAGQIAMAEHANAHMTTVDAPHLSMIARPGLVASVIEEAATATR